MYYTTTTVDQLRIHYLRAAARVAKQEVELAEKFVAKYGDPDLRFEYTADGEIEPVMHGDGTPIKN
jgi:hypothetical protein